MSFPDVVTLAIPLFIILLIAEIIWTNTKRKGAYETRDTATSLLMGAGNVVAGVALGFIAYGFFMWVWQFRFFDLGGSVLTITACFIIGDFSYYWIHRFGHRVRWVWASHVNHHSSQHYNLSTALRQTWTATFTLMMVVRAPAILLGFHPLMVMYVSGLNLIYQFWIHTEAIGKMPRWFEAVMNTPSHHRVHHGRNPKYLDTNYAGVFIIWDKMFGTFQAEEETPTYGLVQNLGTFNPLRVAFHEWLGMLKDVLAPGLTLRQRFFYAFKPPGWSHDDTRKTSDQIKADHAP